MQISRHVFEGAKSAERASQRAARTGFVGKHPVWKAEEDQVLNTHYPNYDAIRKALPTRTFLAIQSRVHALQIRRKLRMWTGADVVRLRKLYPIATMAQLLEAFPGRTHKAIRQYASQMHLRKRFEFKKTGFPLIDAIRTRCKQLGYSMGDLDEIARTKRYFHDAQWSNIKSVQNSALFKAVAALDGELSVTWRDGDS
jgi:hypothetical protein